MCVVYRVPVQLEIIDRYQVTTCLGLYKRVQGAKTNDKFLATTTWWMHGSSTIRVPMRKINLFLFFGQDGLITKNTATLLH